MWYLGFASCPARPPVVARSMTACSWLAVMADRGGRGRGTDSAAVLVPVARALAASLLAPPLLPAHRLGGWAAGGSSA